MYDFYHMCFYFLIYAFLGWCLEVAYAAMVDGKFVNRGFLAGPVCPIYGFGMVLVISALNPIKGNLFFLFFGAVLLTSALEFLTGYVLEKVFHEKWWDYSESPFNLCGYICLRFSILWGLACVFVMRLIQPMTESFVKIIPKTAGIVILCVALAYFVVDCTLTVLAILKIKKQIKGINELEKRLKRLSDGIGGIISDGVLVAKKKTPEVEEALEELQAKYKGLLEHMHDRRLMRAFPNLSNLNKQDTMERIKNMLASAREKLKK